METGQSPSVLILGASGVSYGEPGAPSALHDLVEARLRSATGRAWTCTPGLLFYGPSMAERAQHLVSLNRPDVVVLYLQQYQFTSDKVVYRIRERWPRLYRPAYVLADWWKKAIAGGGSLGAPGRRGWLFRAPLSVAKRLIGAAPEVDVEDAILYTLEAIDRIVRGEDVALVCKLPMESGGGPGREEMLRRESRFREVVGAACLSRHIPYSNIERTGAAARRPWLRKTAEDGMHADPERRETLADSVAAAVLQISGGRSQADKASGDLRVGAAGS